MKPSAFQQTAAAAFAALLLFCQGACRKPPVDPAPPPGFEQPAMHYTEFKNVEVVNIDYTYIDINADGQVDFFFQAMPLGDAASSLLRLRFYVYARPHTELLIGEPDDQTPALRAGDIVKADVAGHAWRPASASVLTEEVRQTPSSAVYWQGTWKDAAPAYLPIRLRMEGRYCYGWLEMSVNRKDRKLVLQGAGLSTEPGKPVKAGG